MIDTPIKLLTYISAGVNPVGLDVVASICVAIYMQNSVGSEATKLECEMCVTRGYCLEATAQCQYTLKEEYPERTSLLLVEQVIHWHEYMILDGTVDGESEYVLNGANA